MSKKAEKEKGERKKEGKKREGERRERREEEDLLGGGYHELRAAMAGCGAQPRGLHLNCRAGLYHILISMGLDLHTYDCA